MKSTHPSTTRTGWRGTLTAVAGVLALALATSDGAQTQALYTNNLPNGVTKTAGGFTIGTEFTVLTNLEVAAFGIWDSGADGLLTSHAFGVWRVNTNSNVGTLIASATVPSGTSGWLFGDYRYVFLPTSLYLTNGLTYRIGAYYDEASDEPYLDNYSGPGTNAVVTFVPSVKASSPGGVHGAHYNVGASLADPSDWGLNANSSYSGPNLLIIPEPSALMLLALGGLILRRRRS